MDPADDEMRIEPDLSQALGVFDGLYEPGYLDLLRSQERA